MKEVRSSQEFGHTPPKDSSWQVDQRHFLLKERICTRPFSWNHLFLQGDSCYPPFFKTAKGSSHFLFFCFSFIVKFKKKKNNHYLVQFADDEDELGNNPARIVPPQYVLNFQWNGKKCRFKLFCFSVTFVNQVLWTSGGSGFHVSILSFSRTSLFWS